MSPQSGRTRSKSRPASPAASAVGGRARTILGIDPGFGRVGWGVIRETNGKLSAVDYGIIETPAGTPFAERIQKIFTKICQLIARHQPDLGGVERLFFSSNTTTAMKVSEARGVILLALAQAKIPVHECTPQAVKQTLSSYGRADKAQVQRMVKVLLNLKDIPKPDDIADALAIAVTAAVSEKL
ncbi:MAG: crossover junction endodeoxyribonuclease RuvC [Patescibacteria group bacterium]